MNGLPTFLPTADESRAAIPIAAAFHRSTRKKVPCLLLPNGEKQPIPAPLAEVMAVAAQAMINGFAVSITIHSGLLTTKQAAEMLACSRQHVVKLIDEGKLPAEKVPGGTHRRIRLQDLLEFMSNEDVHRSKLLNEMTAITEEVGGYDEFVAWKKRREAK